ncbi:MAG: iron-sulfur cluster assembly scaffold protein [Candidatus Dadabacteria bacterium]|nr:iron-sulfur cluster assembly scaffold protein [Candidatus Dadabacteria bacterium]
MIEEERMKMIMDHYENPRNFGPLENPTVILRGGNPNCGDEINIYIHMDGGNLIEDISFDGAGCTISQASTSFLTEFLKGKTVSQLEELDSDYLRELLGKDIMITRPKCSRLALETLKAWARCFQMGKTS